jgi:hypothetical protein
MKFLDFLEGHKKLTPYIDFTPGTPGFVDLVRAWNTLAIMFPDMCEDAIIWEIGRDPRIGINPNNKEYKKAVEKARAKAAKVTTDNDKKQGAKVGSKKTGSSTKKEADINTQNSD